MLAETLNASAHMIEIAFHYLKLAITEDDCLFLA